MHRAPDHGVRPHSECIQIRRSKPREHCDHPAQADLTSRRCRAIISAEQKDTRPLTPTDPLGQPSLLRALFASRVPAFSGVLPTPWNPLPDLVSERLPSPSALHPYC